MKSILKITFISAALVLFLMIQPRRAEPGSTEGPSAGATKESKEQKRSSSGFEIDQSAMCLSASQQAKLIASIVESYSRRLGACAVSNLSFQDDCSADFARLRQGYSQYQLALVSVRNYCR